MKYEITTPGRHDARTCMNVTTSTIAEARKIARKLAARDSKPMYIERVTRTGQSTIIDTVKP